MSLSRTFEVELSAEEMAKLFCELGSMEQAVFLNEVGRISSQWPAGFCSQAAWIISDLSPGTDGRRVIRDLAGQLELDEQERSK